MQHLPEPINGTEQRLDVVISLLRDILDHSKTNVDSFGIGRASEFNEEMQLREPIESTGKKQRR